MLELLAGERQKSERPTAVQACNDWLRLGPGRSLPRLLQKYTKSHQEQPPTRSAGTLKNWSARFDWAAREIEYDATWEQRKNEERAAELEYGLSLDYERVRELKELAYFLKCQLYEQGENDDYHNVWLPDVKQIGSGQDAERVDLERFNGALIQQYREVLNDLAKETGGRAQRVEASGPGGGAIEVRVTSDVMAVAAQRAKDHERGLIDDSDD